MQMMCKLKGIICNANTIFIVSPLGRLNYLAKPLAVECSHLGVLRFVQVNQ